MWQYDKATVKKMVNEIIANEKRRSKPITAKQYMEREKCCNYCKKNVCPRRRLDGQYKACCVFSDDALARSMQRLDKARQNGWVK